MKVWRVCNACGLNTDYKLFKQHNCNMGSSIYKSLDLLYKNILFRIAKNLTYFLAYRVRFTAVKPTP
jgi:hypothetical protein